MPGMRSVVLTLALVPLCTGLAGAAAADRVQVTIWEDVPKPWTWQPPAGDPADRYEVPAMGFVRVPAKYNGRGIEIDRSSPFAVHAETTVQVPAGPVRFVLRSRGSARLIVDGSLVAETDPIRPNTTGDDEVPALAPPEDPRWRYMAPGGQERIVPWTADGSPLRIELWALIGEQKMRPETGELSVSLERAGGVPVLVGGSSDATLTDAGWTAFDEAENLRLDAFDTARRRQAALGESGYWQTRHVLARREVEHTPLNLPPGEGNLIDRVLASDWQAAGVTPGTLVDDSRFFRRLSLDTIGVIPDAAEVEAFLADTHPDKRAKAIEARLADARWADGWMGYWQDVLAENPGILKPTLNNTGPFRNYLHNAFLDNTPFDRFVTELIRMEGSALGGGPAGFGIASQNDAPMAAKAHVVAKAFLAAEMKCARCHDAPFHPFEQTDLFSMAGLLAGKSQTIPGTSTVRRQEGGRVPAVSVSLKEGDVVAPDWTLTEIGPETLPEGLLPPQASSRERLAALVTSPRNARFAPVIVNRLWKRYLGVGLVDPVDDWDTATETRHPALLAALARELITHDYDLKHVARLILNSRIYQSECAADRASSVPAHMIAAPVRRRMSAEQLVDSLFASVGKSFHAEELNLDPDGRRPQKDFLNLGVPRRAWQFTSTSNERDRPALSLPVVQSIVDVLETFGWRPSRQDPITIRDEATTPLQPALLANGVVAARIARLSDDSAITELCLHDQSAPALIRALYLRILSRTPAQQEADRLVAYLGETYSGRIVEGANSAPIAAAMPSRRVSWSNHLSPEATKIQLERERLTRAGDPPTRRLTPEFRERMEDVVWALFNSPEVVFVP
jgi:Protein of unknown function (DUF1553)/Protein of unknown function (DUF1549)